MRELESKCGPVKYIVLSSLALEHKGTTGAFAANFPASSVYVQPGQYSFPVNLPVNFFFPFGKKIREIPSNSSEAPWYGDIDHAILGPLRPPGIGGFAETAFFHRPSKTLLVTDAIVKVALLHVHKIILQGHANCICVYRDNRWTTSPPPSSRKTLALSCTTLEIPCWMR